MNAKESILEKFHDGTLACKTLAEILKILQIPYREKQRLSAVLSALCKDGKLYQNNGGRYGTSEQLG